MPPRDRLSANSSVAYSMQKPLIERSTWAWLTGASIVAFGATLLAHAYIGSFGRFLSDDYCTAGILGSYGFFGAQKHWFLSWTGRFSFVMAIDFAHLIGPRIVPFLTTIVLGAWLAALTWAISQATVLADCAQPKMVSFLLAEMILVLYTGYNTLCVSVLLLANRSSYVCSSDRACNRFSGALMHSSGIRPEAKSRRNVVGQLSHFHCC